LNQYATINFDFMNELVKLCIKDIGIIPYERNNQIFIKALNYAYTILISIVNLIPCNKDAQILLSLVHIHKND